MGQFEEDAGVLQGREGSTFSPCSPMLREVASFWEKCLWKEIKSYNAVFREGCPMEIQ